MPHGFIEKSPLLAGRRPQPRSPASPLSPSIRCGSLQRVDGRIDGPSRTELAVEKVAGLLALATGVGLLAPLVIALQRDETDGIGAAVVAMLSGITLVAGVMLLLGYRPDAEERERFD